MTGPCRPPGDPCDEPGAARERQLALYAGGDLAPTEMAEVRAHLMGCPACRLALEDHRDTRSWLREHRAPAVDAHMLAELRARLDRDLGGRPPRPWLPALIGRAWESWRTVGQQHALAWAAAALLLVGSVGALSHPVRARRGAPGAQTASTTIAAAVAPFDRHEPWETTDDLGDDGEGAEDEAGSEPQEPEGAPRNALRIEMQTPDPSVRIIWFAANDPRRTP